MTKLQKQQQIILNINNFNELNNSYSNIITTALVIIGYKNLRFDTGSIQDSELFRTYAVAGILLMKPKTIWKLQISSPQEPLNQCLANRQALEALHL
jgi:hypothetical protein